MGNGSLILYSAKIVSLRGGGTSAGDQNLVKGSFPFPNVRMVTLFLDPKMVLLKKILPEKKKFLAFSQQIHIVFEEAV